MDQDKVYAIGMIFMVFLVKYWLSCFKHRKLTEYKLLESLHAVVRIRNVQLICNIFAWIQFTEFGRSH